MAKRVATGEKENLGRIHVSTQPQDKSSAANTGNDKLPQREVPCCCPGCFPDLVY